GVKEDGHAVVLGRVIPHDDRAADRFDTHFALAWAGAERQHASLDFRNEDGDAGFPAIRRDTELEAAFGVRGCARGLDRVTRNRGQREDVRVWQAVAVAGDDASLDGDRPDRRCRVVDPSAGGWRLARDREDEEQKEAHASLYDGGGEG